jgi:hypothetical protein
MDFTPMQRRLMTFSSFISLSPLPTIFRYWWVLFIAEAGWIDSLGVEWYIPLQDVSSLLWFYLLYDDMSHDCSTEYGQ